MKRQILNSLYIIVAFVSVAVLLPITAWAAPTNSQQTEKAVSRNRSLVDSQSQDNEITQLLNKMRGSEGAVAQPSKRRLARITRKNGDLRSLGTPAGHYFLVSKTVAGDPTATAKNFIDEQRMAFGVVSDAVDFSLKRSRKRNGLNFERFGQTYSQIPVYGAETLIQLNDAGGVEFAVSDIMRDTSLLDSGTVSTVPAILANDAELSAIALMAQEYPDIQLESTELQLMIYQPEVVGNFGQTRLVWHTIVKSVSVYLVDEVVLVDAHTGEVALRFTQIKHARDREVYDSDNTDADPGTLERSEGDPASGITDVDNCYDFLGDTYDFYFNEHGRDSIDDAGMTLSATVRYCSDTDPLFCPMQNASWSGSRMYFGEGYTTDDITAHELTHGVTDYESNLVYLNESGAINESFSDMWGEWVDLVNGAGNDNPSVRWLTGEDLITGAIRDMADPPVFGDPDRKCSPFWYEGEDDNGGVHTNSGVGNKLCYLLTDGDIFMNVEITGMGISTAADLFYEAQTNLLTTASDYADLHIALTQAAINLGWSEDDKYNLEKACLITELSKRFEPNEGWFYLFTEVDTGNGRIDYINSQGQWDEHPGRTTHSEGEVVELIAVPDNSVHVPHWNGTDNDESIAKENTVTMDDNRYVTASFIEPRILYVGQDSEYQTIQRAINESEPGDIVMISPGTWNIYEASEGHDHLELDGKDITITGVNPDEPNSTIIQGGFIITNVTRNTVIQGLTIRGRYRYANPEDPEDPPGADGFPGRPQHGGGMQLHAVSGLWYNPTKIDSASPTVRNCVFFECFVGGTDGSNGIGGEEGVQSGNGGWGGWAHGGAVSCGPDSNPLFENCIFQGNVATGGDGGSGADGSEDYWPGMGGNWGDETSFLWDYGPFQPYWKYSGYGGAVYIDSNCTAEFIDCNFIDNTVEGGSCGISGLAENDLTVSGWPYQHYKIDRFGGAVYAAADSAPTFINCNFVDNLADANESALHNDETESVPAYQNISYGGAIAFEDGATVTLKGCNFAENNGDVGGGVYFTWSDPYITDCNFIDNSANSGGGILCVGGSGLIENCRFTGNSATIEGGQGGGIASLGANTEIIDTQIVANYAQTSGGGLYISSKGIDGGSAASWNMVMVNNCLIAENTAGSTGAGISSNWYAFTDIDLCTIANNLVFEGGYGGGLYSSYGNYTIVENSILWGNSAANGRQIAIRPSSNPAGVAASNTDIQGGNSITEHPTTGGNIWVAPPSQFQPGAGNIGADIVNDDPLFVSGILGDYYLSQSDDNPCVDAGSASATSLGMGNYTTRTNHMPDRGLVDMGYHYRRDIGVARCGVCDLDPSRMIDYLDLGFFAESWLDTGCRDEDNWCSGADFNFDGVVDLQDAAYLGSCWFAKDKKPPVPNPMLWRITPEVASTTSFFMGAAIAYDEWGGAVEYFFDCSDDAHDRNWSTDPNYTSTGLMSSTQYSYRVMARDEWGNETEFSSSASIVTNEDTTEPEPNPMTWAIPPTAVSNSAIIMIATTATDSSGVEYGFWNLNTGLKIWQDEPTFTDEGLEPLTEYTYQTAARDKSFNKNTTAWSEPNSATTTPDPTPPDFDPPETDGIEGNYKAAFALTPDEVLLSDGYHHQMTAATATDDTEPVQYRFICYDESGFNSGWQTNPFYDVLVSSLQSKSYYKWQVVTRDSVSPTPNVGDLSDYWNCRGQTVPYP